MKFLVLLGVLALAFPFAVCCPEEEEIYPCTCETQDEAHNIKCPNIEDEATLRNAIGGMEGVDNIFTLTIENAVLNYIPHDIFERTQILKIYFKSSSITALSDTDIAFKGLGNILDTLQFYECNFLTSLDFSQLKHMEHLRIFSVVRGDLASIYENMEGINHLNLRQLNFYNNKITHISDYAFSNFTNLEYLSLKKNLLKEVKRTMLPNPAENMIKIDLGYNQIENLPDDFFEGMPVLEYIDISMNKLMILKEETFAPVWSQILRIDAKDNGISCDCRMKWVAEKDDAPNDVRATCARPQSLRGKNLLDLKAKDLWC